MRDIEFHEVGMENFGPYIEPMILQFKTDNIVLLTGPNGVGKTMSLDAIPYTLYGITTKEMKGDDVVNNTIGKNCKTWVKFRINADKYKVTRYRKYTKMGNTVVLSKNKVDIKTGQREVLPVIEKLICTQKAFMNTIMFGQKVKDFFTDLVDSDKKEIFRKILGLEQYMVLYKTTTNMLKDTKEKFDLISTDIVIKQGNLKMVNEQMDILKKAENDFYKDQKKIITELKKRAEEQERLIPSWLKQLQKLQDQENNLEDTNKQITEFDILLKSASEKLNQALDDLTQQATIKVSEVNMKATETKAKTESQYNSHTNAWRLSFSQLQTLNNKKVKEYTDEIHKIQMSMEKIISNCNSINQRSDEIESTLISDDVSECPLCETILEGDAKELLIQKVKKYKEEVEELEKQLPEKKKQINALKEKCKTVEGGTSFQKLYTHNKTESANVDLKEKLISIKEKLNYVLQTIKTLSKEKEQELIDQSDKDYKDMKKKHETLLVVKEKEEKLLDDIQVVKDNISKLEDNIKVLKERQKNVEVQEYDKTQLNSFLGQQSSLMDQIEVLEKKVPEIESEITRLEFWRMAFSSAGIPSMLIDESIPFMNQKISKYLDMISNGRYIVSFDTLAETKSGEFRDKISVRVVDTHTKANRRVQLSGGQTRLVDIATILTLGDLQSVINNVKVNILLFDEIFDALDYENAGYVSKVLNKLKIGKSIYIISHQNQEQLEPDELLTLN